MAKFFSPKLSQSSGELTPLLAGRTDLAAYKNGAKEMTNFIVLPQGGFINRPGTHFVADNMTGCRLIPFVVNTDISFVLVLTPATQGATNGMIYVYDKDGLQATVAGNHPYTADRLQQVKYIQSVDLMFLFQKNFRPLQIKRVGTTWSLSNLTFSKGPYQDMNTDPEVRVWLTKQSASQFYIDATENIFTPNMVGQLFYYEFYKDSYSYSGNSYGIFYDLYGTITIQTFTSFVGTITLKRRGPNEVDYVTISSFTSEGTQADNTYPAWAYSGVEDEIGAAYQLIFSGTTAPKFRIQSSGGTAAYQFTMFSYSSPTRMFMNPDTPDINDVIQSISTYTSTWAIGSFGADRGWPALAVFHQERLVLANSIAEPTTIWMSKPANWTDFDTTIPTEDTDSITVTLASQQVNEIRALSSREDLLIFTAGAEFVARAGSQNDVFTPSSIVITPTGYRGAYDTNVLDIGISTLFVQKHGNVVRGLGYKLETDGYDSSELSVLSQHLFEGKQIVRWAYQQDPWSIVWIVLNTGEVLAFTFVQEHQVSAWTRHVFNTGIVDLCVIPGDGQDDVFMIAGDHLVYMEHRQDTTGWTADMYQDEDVTYTSVYESLELEEEQAQGTVQGRMKQVPNLVVRLFRTCGIKTGIMTENSNKVDVAQIPYDDFAAYRTEPYTGDLYLSVPGAVGRENRVRIENDQPTPVTVLGFWREVDMEDDA